MSVACPSIPIRQTHQSQEDWQHFWFSETFKTENTVWKRRRKKQAMDMNNGAVTCWTWDWQRSTVEKRNIIKRKIFPEPWSSAPPPKVFFFFVEYLLLKAFKKRTLRVNLYSAMHSLFNSYYSKLEYPKVCMFSSVSEGFCLATGMIVNH